MATIKEFTDALQTLQGELGTDMAELIQAIDTIRVKSTSSIEAIRKGCDLKTALMEMAAAVNIAESLSKERGVSKSYKEMLMGVNDLLAQELTEAIAKNCSCTAVNSPLKPKPPKPAEIAKTAETAKPSAEPPKPQTPKPAGTPEAPIGEKGMTSFFDPSIAEAYKKEQEVKAAEIGSKAKEDAERTAKAKAAADAKANEAEEAKKAERRAKAKLMADKTKAELAAKKAGSAPSIEDVMQKVAEKYGTNMSQEEFQKRIAEITADMTKGG